MSHPMGDGGTGTLKERAGEATDNWAVTYQPAFAVLTVKAGSVHVPDQASTFLLLTLGLFGLLTCRCQLLRKPT